jgi:uncharacterized membrane protein YhdT
MHSYLKYTALFYFLNGLAMLVLPQFWYLHTPGAAETGPFNAHFVRDIGIAFVVSGCSLWFSMLQRGLENTALAWSAMAFLTGHALLHLVEMATMGMTTIDILRDFALIVLPIVFAVICLMNIGTALTSSRRTPSIN